MVYGRYYYSIHGGYNGLWTNLPLGGPIPPQIFTLGSSLRSHMPRWSFRPHPRNLPPWRPTDSPRADSSDRKCHRRRGSDGSHPPAAIFWEDHLGSWKKLVKIHGRMWSNSLGKGEIHIAEWKIVTGKMGTSSMVQNQCEYVKTI